MDSLPDPIGDLLDLAGIAKAPEIRSKLEQTLEIARGAYGHKHQKQAPSDLFEQLDASIRKTLMLVEKLGKYRDTLDLAFEQHPIGTGIADAVTGRQMLEEGRNLRISRRSWVDKGIPHTSADHVIVGINVENLLRAFRVNVKNAQRRNKRGHPRRTDKLSVVLYAADFFRAFSAIKPSTDERNPFRLFVERFFELVTGTEPVSLEWQVRQALGNYDDPRAVGLLYGAQREKPKKGK
jgi:hypothetical protein